MGGSDGERCDGQQFSPGEPSRSFPLPRNACNGRRGNTERKVVREVSFPLTIFVFPVQMAPLAAPGRDWGLHSWESEIEGLGHLVGLWHSFSASLQLPRACYSVSVDQYGRQGEFLDVLMCS